LGGSDSNFFIGEVRDILREDSASVAQGKAFAKKNGHPLLLFHSFRLELQYSSDSHLVSPAHQSDGGEWKCGKFKTVLENGCQLRPAFFDLC